MFKDHDVVAFLSKHNLTEQYAKMYFSELKSYVDNKQLYELQFNGNDIILVRKINLVNKSLTYLDQPFFKDNIDLINLDINDNPSKQLVITKYSENTKRGFYLTGKNGVGKTSLVVSLCNHHYEKTKEKTLFVFWPDFIEKTKRFSNNNVSYINKVKNSPRLIIDDIGQESLSQWSRDDILSPIITYRLERKLFTVITSNYTIEELKSLYTDKPINSKKVLALVNKIKTLSPEFVIVGKDYRSE